MRQKWEKFVTELFAAQDGFIEKTKTCLRAIRNQLDSRIDRFKALHGSCQNLSEFTVDLGRVR